MPTLRVGGIPSFIDPLRLLGEGPWRLSRDEDGAQRAEASLSVREAAEIAARLRGVGLDGRRLSLECTPPLPRAAVRAARAEDARRRRGGSVGFLRPGARLDEEGRYSLTPEPLADAIAAQAAGRALIDATAGCGGNSIAFARAGCSVAAIERDPARASLLRHNLRVYGVERRVRVRVGDALEQLEGLKAPLLFVDPPWGLDWDRERCALSDFPLLEALLARAPAAGATELWAKLPPSFATQSVPGSRAEAYFGAGEGDARRVKFILLRMLCSPR